jgi:hypothetical protein
MPCDALRQGRACQEEAKVIGEEAVERAGGLHSSDWPRGKIGS